MEAVNGCCRPLNPLHGGVCATAPLRCATVFFRHGAAVRCLCGEQCSAHMCQSMHWVQGKYRRHAGAITAEFFWCRRVGVGVSMLASLLPCSFFSLSLRLLLFVLSSHTVPLDLCVHLFFFFFFFFFFFLFVVPPFSPHRQSAHHQGAAAVGGGRLHLWHGLQTKRPLCVGCVTIVSLSLSFCHSVILSFCHSVILSFCHSVSVSLSPHLSSCALAV